MWEKRKLAGMGAKCLFLRWVKACVDMGANGLAGPACYRGSSGP